jgi:hypothetical protein
MTTVHPLSVPLRTRRPRRGTKQSATRTPQPRCTVIRLLAGLLAIAAVAAAAEKTSRHGPIDLRFAFTGDIHYNIPNNYAESTYITEPMARDLAALNPRPALLLQSGDFVTAAVGTDIEAEAEFAYRDFFAKIGLPAFIARGNHDVRSPYERLAWPIFSKQLGRTIDRNYFSFDRANCHFVILDCAAPDLTPQLAWLDEDLRWARARTGIQHIFVVAHYPLWIVVRSGFTREEYAHAVAAIVAKHKVDAYLCGHTHNRTTTVQRVNGHPLTQIMSAALTRPRSLFNHVPYLKHVNPTPPTDLRNPGIHDIEESRTLLIPREKLLYGWGYLEGSTGDFYVFTVRGAEVTVDWHVRGEGPLRSFKWSKPGELVDLKAPPKPPKAGITEADVAQLAKAWLYVAPWTNEGAGQVPVRLNGVLAAAIDIPVHKYAIRHFWEMLEVPLKPGALKAIRSQNVLEIGNPDRKIFGLANVLLLVQLRDGRFFKTGVAPSVFTSFKPDASHENFPPPEVIRSVSLGQPLAPISLTFERSFPAPAQPRS